MNLSIGRTFHNFIFPSTFRMISVQIIVTFFLIVRLPNHLNQWASARALASYFVFRQLLFMLIVYFILILLSLALQNILRLKNHPVPTALFYAALGGMLPVLTFRTGPCFCAVPREFYFLYFLMALNTFLMVLSFGCSLGQKHAIRKALLYSFPVSDLFTPLAFFGSDNDKPSRRNYAQSVFPMIPLALLSATLLLKTVGLQPPVCSYPGMERIERTSAKTLILKDDDRGFWFSDEGGIYYKEMDSAPGMRSRSFRLPDSFENFLFNDFTLIDNQRNLLFSVNDLKNEEVHLYRLDSSTFAVERHLVYSVGTSVKRNATKPISLAAMGDAVAFLVDEQRSITLAAFEGAPITFSEDLGRLNALIRVGQVSDAVLDPARRNAYLAFYWPFFLVSCNVDDLKPLHALRLTGTAVQVMIDAEKDRLFVAFPKSASIGVVDLKTFRFEKFIPALPGVRAMAMDKKRKLLLAAGFSPYMELFDLETFEKIGGISSPPWARKIIFSRDGSAYFISTMDGIWKGNLDDLLHAPKESPDIILRTAAGVLQRIQEKKSDLQDVIADFETGSDRVLFKGEESSARSLWPAP